MTNNYQKKLIEVALPLEAINTASAREKSIRHGHPSTLHLWWARRPLATARAVIFAQMVDDPASLPEEFPTPEAQETERQRLFRLIEELVKWENTTNEDVLERARYEIRRSWRRWCKESGEDPETLPPFHDPFAGGGALPLEAQRLGLEAHASDLNPVAVLINKAMIEIPPKFAGCAPVNPKARQEKSLIAKTWRGAQGLAEDVRYYGQWMRDEAEKRIGHLYPKVEVTAEVAAGSAGILPARPDLKPYVGRKLTVIAWLWARTVKSPNPAFANVDVPLASTFMLSTKAGKEAYVEPVISPLPTSPLWGEEQTPSPSGGGSGWGYYRFTVKVGKPKDVEAVKNGTKLARGANFCCIMSETPISGDYIRSEAQAGRMGARLMAIVAEGDRGRIYLSPSPEHEAIARQAQPTWKPELKVPTPCHDVDRLPMYGMPTWGDAFTPRQLVALTTFSDLVQETRDRVKRDALAACCSPLPDPPPLGEGVCSSPQRGEVGRGEQWQPTPVPLALLQAARDLRKNMTDAEQALWQCLRSKQLDGFKFRKQHPIERFVLDFYCPSAKLAIELDGGHHNTEAGKTKDADRTACLEQRSIRVLRFWNHEVLGNLDGVLTRIWDALHDGPHPNPPPLGFTPTQPSPAGGGLSGSSPQRGEVGRGDDIPLRDGGTGTQAYADAVAMYLAFALSKQADLGNSLCRWEPVAQCPRQLFGRQAIPMIWDFAEGNQLGDSSGAWVVFVDGIAKAFAKTFEFVLAKAIGFAQQADAGRQEISNAKIVSTDPPYYDNIGYADLSDFFYVWLRRSLKPIFPDLFATLAVPKAEELVATPYRHGSKQKAEAFFLDGMTQAMHRLAEQAHLAFPVTIYYAFKQSETESEAGTSSTGWETFLDAVICAGFAISGTWPMRTELGNRLIGMGTNALASSIVLVCRKRAADVRTATRREFVAALKAELPEVLTHLQRGNIAPVDLAQAAIGPGMAIYTRYAKVLDAAGQPLSVREALALINQTLDEVLAEQEDDFDADTRWALAWFDQFGFAEGEFGVAETLSKAKNTSVSGLAEAGILVSKGGKVRLLHPDELPTDWDPARDPRLTVWEMVHHLVRALDQGETVAAELVAKLGSKADTTRELAYRLYTVCERKKRAHEALSYNALVQSWPEIARLAREEGKPQPQIAQDTLFKKNEE